VSNPVLEQELKRHESKFTENEELILFIGSWNVGGWDPKESVLLFDWLYHFGKESPTPDIYIIGLQEIVDLNAKNIVIFSNSTKVEFWRKTIFWHLNQIDKYVDFTVLDLVGIFLIIFVKESLKENVKNIDTLIVKSGLLGTMGNKGSCLLRFNYNDTSIAISSGHLSAGSNYVSARVAEINDILNKSFPKKNNLFKEHDIQFIFGDLNFRIDLEYNTCIQMIKFGSLQTLADYDQLNKAKSTDSNLIKLVEGPLNFEPTYKYIVGTSEYHSKKKRTPSWCDRILFMKNDNIEVIDYNRIEFTNSDHKPIYGFYKIKTVKIDTIKKKQIAQEINDNFTIGVAGEEYINDITSKLKFNIIGHINDDFFNSDKLNNLNDLSDNKYNSNSPTKPAEKMRSSTYNYSGKIKFIYFYYYKKFLTILKILNNKHFK
jgi:hypothetical protein